MKRFKFLKLTLFLLILFLFLSPNLQNRNVFASEDDEMGQIIGELIDGLDLSSLQQMFDEYVLNGNENLTLKDKILQIINGDLSIDYQSVLNMIKNMFFSQMKNLLPNFLILLAISVFCGFLYGIQPEKNDMGDIVFLSCLFVCVLIIFSQMISAFNYCKQVINKTTKQTEIVLPLLFTLVSLCGSNVSASIYQPACVFLVGGVLQIINNLLLPIIYATCVLSVISGFSEKYSLNYLNDSFISVFKWIIGIIIAIFSVFMTLQGISASTYDGIFLKAFKYTVGNSVPIISGFVKDGVDLVLCGLVLVKNAVGNIVIIAIIYAFLSPLAYVICLSLMLKFLSAVITPLGDKRIGKVISSFSKVLTMLASVLIMVLVMYFITIILIICTKSAVI